MALFSRLKFTFLVLCILERIFAVNKTEFVTVSGRNFYLNDKTYYYLGANLWYGMNLGAPISGNLQRLQSELDYLVQIGIKNLRVIASTQGPEYKLGRVVPSLEYDKEKYNYDLWIGLDVFLNEMGKRDMKAVVILNNFWEWSGGFGQIKEWYTGEFSDFPTSFYNAPEQMEHYNRLAKKIILRNNTITHKLYRDDPTIMAWQLANEPRGEPQCDSFVKWVDDTSKFIHEIDENHLISIGNEGAITVCSEYINKLPHVDYITFHVWLQNWDWFFPTSLEESSLGINRATRYIIDNVRINVGMNKPIVLEEFGLARDYLSFDPDSPVTVRNQYYKFVFEIVYKYASYNSTLSGVNFWTYSGKGRPRSKDGEKWLSGDDFIGDAPYERQGWYSVYDSDKSTLKIVEEYTSKFDSLCGK